MLLIQDLTIQDLKNHILIEHFSFSLGERDKVAIIGEEGNGKSTLLKAIYQRESIEEYMSISGRIDMDYKNIGFLYQQLPNEWYTFDCMEYLLKQTPMEEIAYERYNELAELEILCVKLHIPLRLLESEQPLASLSGGEKVKIQLLKLIHQDCDILLLDEPTNDLDIETLEWLEDFIRTCTMPILFISHDEVLLRNCANRILHLEQLNKKSKARISDYHGTYDAYTSMRKEKLNKDTQIAQKEKQEYMKKKIKLNDFKNAVHDALNDTVRNPGQAALLAKKMANIKAQEKRFDRESYGHVDSVEEAIDVYFQDIDAVASKRIIDACVSVSIAHRELIKPYELLVKGQDKVVFVGQNGCGKTLLMKQLYELLKECKGVNVGYMPQNYMDYMNPESTPVAFLLTRADQEDVSSSRELLGRMKFTSEEMIQPIKDISEGQKAKLYLLRFIKCKCNVLLLDEPTRNLSPLSAPLIRSILSDYKGCIISVSHDRMYIDEVANRILEINHNEIRERK